MHGFLKDNFLYIPIFKNGSSTFSQLLKNNNWQPVETNEINLAPLRIWSHITDPHTRHTKGLEQYLSLNLDVATEVENNPLMAKMIMSTTLCQHSYSISMLLGSLMQYSIYWIPLDTLIMDCTNRRPTRPMLNGNDLTNDFFEENQLELRVTDNDSKNVIASKDRIKIRKQIEQYKELYKDNYNLLAGNLLTEDIKLYNTTIQNFVKKYAKNT